MPPPIAFSHPCLQQLPLPFTHFPRSRPEQAPAELPAPPQPEVADGIGQDRGRGREAEEETTIAQPEIGLGAADAQPRAVTVKPVAFPKFIRGLFSLSPTRPAHPERGPTTRRPRGHRLCPGSYRLLRRFPSDTSPSPPLSPRHLYSCFLPSSCGLRCKGKHFSQPSACRTRACPHDR